MQLELLGQDMNSALYGSQFLRKLVIPYKTSLFVDIQMQISRQQKS